MSVLVQRRDFIAILSGAAAAWPLAARAQQQPVLPVVGFLSGASAWEYTHVSDAFRKGLSETGFVEGRNVFVEYRWADGHYERLPTFAHDLVRRQVLVIVASGTPSVQAAKAATSVVPIVFHTAADPVEIGLVAGLNRPGGNLTGVAVLNVEIGPKRLQMLHELIPAATRVAYLVNPTNPTLADIQSREMQAAARTLGLELQVLQARNERDFEAVFATLGQSRGVPLVIGVDVFFASRAAELASLALRHAVPTMYQFREFVAAGGLMSYGGSLTEQYRQVGLYTGRILKGDKPTDLPVQQEAKIELIINMKTAKALGLTFPITLLGRADEVIE